MNNFSPRVAARVKKRVEARRILVVPAGERFLAELPDDPFFSWGLGESPEGAEQDLFLKLYQRHAREVGRG